MDGARIFHVNVNCTELERSRRFYIDAFGLTASVRTAPDVVQPGTAFGLERARWDAWVLLGTSGYDGGAVDLLEWQEPRPTGAVPASFATTGFQRIGISVPDLDATVARVRRAGGAGWSDVHAHEIAGRTVRLVMANDPDGVAIELIEGDGPRVSFVACGCTDLERSVAFYTGLGFREFARFPTRTDDAAHLRIGGPAEFDEVMLAAPGGGEVSLILVEFAQPSVERAPARPANAVGMWRLALLVDDLDDAIRAPVATGATLLSDPVEMAMGDGLPVLRFVCFRGLDDEVIELIEQPA
jgi:catechol 2,3-dioxygenase-like lactoylglutathione lyase family enzyme